MRDDPTHRGPLTERQADPLGPTHGETDTKVYTRACVCVDRLRSESDPQVAVAEGLTRVRRTYAERTSWWRCGAGAAQEWLPRRARSGYGGKERAGALAADLGFSQDAPRASGFGAGPVSTASVGSFG